MHEIGYFVYNLIEYFVIFSNGVRLKRVYDLSEKKLENENEGVRLKEGGLRRVHKLQIGILADEIYHLPVAIASQKKN